LFSFLLDSLIFSDFFLNFIPICWLNTYLQGIACSVVGKVVLTAQTVD
jgi:hypothetical protein